MSVYNVNDTDVNVLSSISNPSKVIFPPYLQMSCYNVCVT